jgi:hypothetical protein
VPYGEQGAIWAAASHSPDRDVEVWLIRGGERDLTITGLNFDPFSIEPYFLLETGAWLRGRGAKRFTTSCNGKHEQVFLIRQVQIITLPSLSFWDGFLQFRAN